jgi:preprotein translocase subunit SecF
MFTIIKPNTNYNFMGYRHHLMIVSAILLVISIFLVCTKGLNWGIDFTGGVEIHLTSTNPSLGIAEIRKTVEGLYKGDIQVQNFGEKTSNDYLIRVQGKDEELQKVSKTIEKGISDKFGEKSFIIQKVDVVGGKVGKELRLSSLLSVFYALLGILIYIGLRFDFRYSPGGVICLAHDVVIAVGAYSLLRMQFTLATVASLLTLVGYSINDTVVVYDRIRETAGKMRGKDLIDIINRAINDTLSRTMLTSLTVFIVILVLHIMAGDILGDFTLGMLVGNIVGTYSSVFVASPLIITTDYLIQKRKAAKAARLAKA